MPGFDLVILDLDLTLWDHPDASSLSPPFRRTGRDSASDSSGIEVRLRPGAREFLEACRSLGVAVGVASWNSPGPALSLMAALGLLGLVDFPVIRDDPDKVPMVAEVLRLSGAKVDRTVFVDDRPENVRAVARAFPGIRALTFGIDVPDFRRLGAEVLGPGPGPGGDGGG